jgi:hypothetical protein
MFSSDEAIAAVIPLDIRREPRPPGPLAPPEEEDPDTEQQFAARAQAVRAVNAEGVPFVVAGAYALRTYAGIYRDTKDLDLFVRRADVPRTLAALDRAGFRTEVTDPVWLAKGFHPSGEFVDVIFSSGNGVAEVDEGWFARARATVVLGEPAWVAPPEEIIWSKAFVCERERYDGADISHVLRHCVDELDWGVLEQRFAAYPEVLLIHLVLFRFTYPGLRDRVPQDLLERLLEHARAPARGGEEDVCRGTILSRYQFLSDLRAGLRDARKVEVPSFRAYHDGRE